MVVMSVILELVVMPVIQSVILVIVAMFVMVVMSVILDIGHLFCLANTLFYSHRVIIIFCCLYGILAKW